MSLPDPTDWKRLSPLLDELIDLDVEAASARLQAIARTDPAVAEQLGRLLGRRDKPAAQAFLQGPVPSLVHALAPARAGERIGHHTLVSPLGEGGSGAVWRAHRHDGPVEAQVAVKLLHRSLLRHAAAGRFAREAQYLSRLNHPHIAALLDAGVSDAGQPYLLLELVDGEPIDSHCRRLRLGVTSRLKLFLDVLDAVAHAHQHLLVHRDLKPANVLVTAQGQVKLLDFGIAKLINDELGEEAATVLTREAGRALTPSHAAPEQFEGGTITTATDVYALGVMLYELLSGRHPTAPAAGTRTEVIRAALQVDPLPLSRAMAGIDASAAAEIALERASKPEQLARQLSGDLDLIVARMLQKTPSERYPSATAVAMDLRRHLAHEPVSVRPNGWLYRARRFSRRHRAGVLACALVAMAAGAGMVATLLQAHHAQHQAEAARVQRDTAQRQASRAELATDFMYFVLGEGLASPTATSEVLSRAEQMVEREYAADAEMRSRMLLLLATVQHEAGNKPRADALLTAAAQAARALRDPALQGLLQCAEADLADERWPAARVRDAFAQATAALRQAGDSYALADCLRSQSRQSARRGDAVHARALQEEASRVLSLARKGSSTAAVTSP